MDDVSHGAVLLFEGYRDKGLGRRATTNALAEQMKIYALTTMVSIKSTVAQSGRLAQAAACLPGLGVKLTLPDADDNKLALKYDQTNPEPARQQVILRSERTPAYHFQNPAHR
jgi:hypothetical protein